MNSKRFDGVHYSFRKITDLKDLLVTSSEMFADKTAYLEKDRKLKKWVPITYRQVKTDMDALGTKFIDMGLKGQKIAVIGETSYHWILTYFTTVAGVGVIAPMDKNLPSGELLGLMDRAKVSAIVYSKKCRKSIEPLFESSGTIKYFISMDAEEHDGRELSLKKLIEEGSELLDGGRGDRRYIDADVNPNSMCTLLFTSGTTGMAKGVMISHINIASNVYEMSKFFRIPDDGVVYSILPIHHVYEMTCDIWTTYYQGQTIAICEGLKYLMQGMNEVKANVMLGVPLVFEKLYKGIWKAAKKSGQDEKLRRGIDLSKRFKLYNNRALVKRMFKSVHDSFGGHIEKFVVGGAAADPFISEEFEAMGFPIVQGYGMSECSPIIALNPDRYRKAASVGQTLPGGKIRIIDPDEDGVGEVAVKSPSVMIGYYENEDATEDSLRDGWLYTGDLGYFDEDGFLYLTGRSKTVIVTKGGKNIFPEEVEAVLMQNELIQEVVVHGVEDSRGGNVIVTADIFPNHELLTAEKGELSAEEIDKLYNDIVEELNRTMPAYKQVKHVNIREEEFVKTTTGKIKRFGNKIGKQEEQAVEAADSVNTEYKDRKTLELRRARRFAQDIRNSEDPHVVHKDMRAITDVRDLIRSSAEMYSSSTAFIHKGTADGKYQKVTYEQARADIEALGTALISRGLKNARIAVIGDNWYEWQISFLSIMCGVGTVVPLDKKLGQAEIMRRLRVAGVTAVIFDESHGEMFRDIQARMPEIKTLIRFRAGDNLGLETGRPEDGVISWHALLEAGRALVACDDRSYIDAEVTGLDLAAIIFTAGKSREAKGVMISHENIVYDLMAAASMVGFTSRDIVFSLIPAHNMYECSMGILMPLYKGAAIASAETTQRLHSNMSAIKPTVFLAEPYMIKALYDRIRDFAERRGLGDRLMPSRSIMSRIGSAFGKIGDSLGLDSMKPVRDLAQEMMGGKLRMVISGGSIIRAEILEFFGRLNLTAIQGYGLTECSPVAAISPDKKDLAKYSAAGHVLPGVEIRVDHKDENGIGEILVKGKNITAGYYRDIEATVDAIENGWLHTGDLGFVDEEGYVHLTGQKIMPMQY